MIIENLVSHLNYHYKDYTSSEQLIVQYLLNNDSVSDIKIQDLSEAIFVSTATISRFANKVGFRNYKAFLYELHRSKQELLEIEDGNKDVTESLWHVHEHFFKTIYNNIAKIDLKYIANMIHQSELVYVYGFGKAQDMTEMLLTRLEEIKPKIKTTKHFEHLHYTIENILNYKNLIIIFYQHNSFEKDVLNLIELSKKKFVPIIIVSLSADIDARNYATVVKLYPDIDKTIPVYTTTMYAPYLVFIDSLFSMLQERINRNTDVFSVF